MLWRHRRALAFLGVFLVTQACAETAGSAEEIALTDVVAASASEWSGKRVATAQGKTRGPGGFFECRCAGKADQSGKGAKCETYGFRTTWCYVESGCSDEAAVEAPGMQGMKKMWACHTFKGNPSKSVKISKPGKLKVAKNQLKMDKKGLETALKQHANDEGAVKHNDEV